LKLLTFGLAEFYRRRVFTQVSSSVRLKTHPQKQIHSHTPVSIREREKEKEISQKSFNF